MKTRLLFALAVLLTGSSFGATDVTEQRLARLEQRVSRLDSLVSIGLVSAAICALWAQNTGRNPWLWFFLGLIFSVLALFFLLYKNADDLRVGRTVPRTRPR